MTHRKDPMLMRSRFLSSVLCCAVVLRHDSSANTAQAKYHGTQGASAEKPSLPDHQDALRQLQHLQC